MTLKSLMLRNPICTLAVAESLTCGRVQAEIGSESGASSYFLGGVTAYTLEQKVDKLGVNRSHAESVKCVSAQVAAEMACGVCDLFESDIGIGTTGYAEPSPVDGIEFPLAYWAIASKIRGKMSVVRQGLLEKDGIGRVQMQIAVTALVVDELMSYLKALKEEKI
jgi:nicotinamide-nucleotide amidase